MCTGIAAGADEAPTVLPVDGQPLAAASRRLLESLEALGRPLPAADAESIRAAADVRDSAALQKLIDRHVAVVVNYDGASPLKVSRGPAPLSIQQHGYTPLLIKVLNPRGVQHKLRAASPQAGTIYAGVTPESMRRQGQTHLLDDGAKTAAAQRFLDLELHDTPAVRGWMTGLEVQYFLLLASSSEAGERKATLKIDVAQRMRRDEIRRGGRGREERGASEDAKMDWAENDPSMHGDLPVAFDVRPAVPVSLRIFDHDGLPATARLELRDAAGHICPPQPKRLAPDFFFQGQVYRSDGGTVLLSPGKYVLLYNRGPEYKVMRREVEIKPEGNAELRLDLERWVNPAGYGFYSGDHHIHAAGCAHYTSPTEGVTPDDMLLQVQGEGLNVGCVLTWGPCFEHQRQFFSPAPREISQPFTLLKYDLEISGFGSQALGHVCLLNLHDQTYPGSEGTKTKSWPTWTTPVLRWAKSQGAVTGYAHSASGLHIDPNEAAIRLMDLDANQNGFLDAVEAERGLLPDRPAALDTDGNKLLSKEELVAGLDRVADTLPNLAVPEMDGVGAMEICVSASEGVCDFISAMDTPRIAEWNCWYHLLNCGLPIKVSGETDFPCMSSTRVGQGRVYVQLGKVERLDFAAWCAGLGRGQSYVSDGYAHALQFTVNGVSPGTKDVQLAAAGKVTVHAKVAFAPATPATLAQGLDIARGVSQIARKIGDTVEGGARDLGFVQPGGKRNVELVVNSRVVASTVVEADGQPHEVAFDVPIERSSWVALRQFPQLHTNPVNVIVGGKPIRASRASARWCAATIEQLWRTRGSAIAEPERKEAHQTFLRAIERYKRWAQEALEGT